MKALDIHQLCALVGGNLVGTPVSETFTGVSSLKEADPHHVSFLGNRRYRTQVTSTRAAAVLIPPGFDEIPRAGQNFIQVANPSLAFAKVVEHFAPPPVPYTPGLSPLAFISPEATLGHDCTVEPFAVIEAGAHLGNGCHIGAGCYIGHEAVLGNGCFLYPQVTVRDRCLVGSHVTLHSGVVIGSDGFGFDLESGNTKIPQTGIVQIDDHVEIGANTTVDRARFGRTWIQSGVKIDNLVQVGHNVVIRKNAVIVAQAGISGSTVIGERAILAGQAGTVGHIEIGERAIVTAKTGVSKDVPPGQIMAGQLHPHPMKEFLEFEACLNRVPSLLQKIHELEKRLAALEDTHRSSP